MKFDITLYLYGVETVMALYGFCLFSWWWIKVKKASPMYVYVTLMFLSIFLRTSVSTYARWLRCNEPGCYYDFMTGWVWSGRLYLQIIITGAIISHMSYRAFYLRLRD